MSNNTGSGITKEQRERFEKYLKEHPIKEDDELDPDVFDDDRMNYNHQAGCSRIAKMILEGKIK